MTGKQTLDRAKVIALIREGLNRTQIIARWREYNLDPKRTTPPSRQAISDIKRDAIKKGLLQGSTKRVDLVDKPVVIERTREVKKMKQKLTHDAALLSLNRDQLEEISLTMYERALQFPVLKDRINRLENQLASARNELKIKEAQLVEIQKVDLRIRAAKSAVIHGE
ncbi:MAG: hypothetical protein WC479_10470 [Candidatus Izemoplasmatales bacterium]